MEEFNKTEGQVTLLEALLDAGYPIGPGEEDVIYTSIVTAAGDVGFDMKESNEDNIVEFVEEHKEKIFPGVGFKDFINEEEY